MSQDVNNENNKIGAQLNVAGDNYGNIDLTRKTRFSARFKKLNEEVVDDNRYDGIIEDLKYYNTILDGVDMPTKLADGGFGSHEIRSATRKKEKYAKKSEKFKFFESAQWIDCQLFAKIIMEFETYIDPLIENGATKKEILSTVSEKIVNPILTLINEEGKDDEMLNYDAGDIYGMIYYLTGKCHINWKNYDNI